jgi:hypothetical protein
MMKKRWIALPYVLIVVILAPSFLGSAGCLARGFLPLG